MFHDIGAQSIDRHDGQVGQQSADRITEGSHIGAEIGFGDQNNWRGAGVLGQREIALNARQIELLVRGGDDKHCVHIGGHQLNVVGGAGALALKNSFSFENACHAMVFVNENPIAGGGGFHTLTAT